MSAMDESRDYDTRDRRDSRDDYDRRGDHDDREHGRRDRDRSRSRERERERRNSRRERDRDDDRERHRSRSRSRSPHRRTRSRSRDRDRDRDQDRDHDRKRDRDRGRRPSHSHSHREDDLYRPASARSESRSRDRDRDRDQDRERRRDDRDRRDRDRDRNRDHDRDRPPRRRWGSMSSSQPVFHSEGGPMNAPPAEAEAHARVSRRENRLYVGNLKYEVTYKDLERFMRQGTSLVMSCGRADCEKETGCGQVSWRVRKLCVKLPARPSPSELSGLSASPSPSVDTRRIEIMEHGHRAGGEREACAGSGGGIEMGEGGLRSGTGRRRGRTGKERGTRIAEGLEGLGLAVGLDGILIASKEQEHPCLAAI
ncbi:hypothetical protein CC85DRAFT_281993 [Cutaneotrichosporon oleaginosum]|uniref:RRM domain-containing protein n=1 Tax=Cutaneotrichosporon oleaginosum TaxID=879819 RepID=A0A0J0XXN1_9TREE|nr:uncharacterized protein CC85DRAFT_281993 [Cutaneotrichosporon oleaginosum]KLT45840.1 hypothetical protein CC85DRAFT_281993 [Cutaneotrichosporon oleaginosum]